MTSEINLWTALSVRQAAALMGVSYQRVYCWIRQGRVKALRRERPILIAPEDAVIPPRSVNMRGPDIAQRAKKAS